MRILAQPILAQYRFWLTEILERIDAEFDVGNYVGNITSHGKIQNDRHIGSVPANW